MTNQKIKINPGISPFPMPVVIVGSIVNNRPNFMTVAWFSRLNSRPNLWGFAIGKKQYTLEGLTETREFSLNIPDVDLVVKTDYAGIVSGRKEDKSSHFEIFFGESKNAPMIRECPVNAECTVYDIIELPGTMLVVGEIIHAYAEEIYTTDRVLDSKKVRPFVFTAPEHHYRELGEKIGTAFVDGKGLSKNE
ncbi:MAG: flavin reductase family protein [Candidatus Thorarchaeota archaeon]